MLEDLKKSELPFGSIIQLTIRTFFKEILNTLILALAIALPSMLLLIGLSVMGGLFEDSLLGLLFSCLYFVASFVVGFLTLWMSLALFKLYAGRLEEKRNKPFALLQATFYQALKLFVTNIMYSVVIFIFYIVFFLIWLVAGFAAGLSASATTGGLGIMGVVAIAVGLLLSFAVVCFWIWLAVKWIFIYPLAAIDDVHFFEAFSQSSKLVKGRWWKTFLYLLGYGLGIFLITGLLLILIFGIGIAVGAITGVSGAPIGGVVILLLSFLLLPVWFVLIYLHNSFATVLYLNWRENKRE